MARFLTAALGVSVLVLGSAAPARADSRKQYRVTLPDAVEVEPGADSSVSLTIAARPGYVISRDGPLLVVLGSGEGLKLVKKRYRRSDAADARADNPRFDLRYRSGGSGEHTLEVAMRFWVCTRRTCRPIRERRTVVIKVIAEEPPVDAGTESASHE